MPPFRLAPAPFPRLRALLRPLQAHADPIDLALGEPQSGFPAFVRPFLKENLDDYAHYPPAAGAPFLREAAARWLTRRFHLPQNFINPDKNILALSGTREGLFSLMPALILLESQKSKKEPTQAPQKKRVLIPDPAYHAYAAAALYAGLEPNLLPASPETGFLPDFSSLPPDLLAQTLAIYLSSPANPQGAAANIPYLQNLLSAAQKYRFTLVLDECYADIYNKEPPPSALQAALKQKEGLCQLMVFHSLSKRSGAPGLRSGFAAGGADIIAAFKRLRESGGAQMPLPLQKASAALWDDDEHAAENRNHYRARFALAQKIFGDDFGFYIPDGGFFLWLDVEDGERAAARAWEKGGVRTLPGAYLAQARHRPDPARRFLRVALVESEARLKEGLSRLRESLETPS